MKPKLDDDNGLIDNAVKMPVTKHATGMTVESLPVEILRLTFECRILSFDDYRELSLVCKRFHTIMKGYLFRTLVLGVDEEGPGYEWMMNLAGSNSQFTQGIIRAVLKNDWKDYEVYDSRCMSVDKDEQAVNPWPALQVLSNMTDLSTLVVEDYEMDYDEGFSTIPIVGFSGSDCNHPTMSLVHILTIDPDASNSSFSVEFYGLAIRSCPNVTTLRINCHSLNPYHHISVWEAMGSAFKEASVLSCLQNLELFRFGHFCEELVDEMEVPSSGWSPYDIEAVHSYFPHISKLSLYGNLNVILISGGAEYSCESQLIKKGDPIEQRSCTIQDFIPSLAAFQNLKQLIITDEQMLKCDLDGLVNTDQRLSHARRDASCLSKPADRLERAHEIFSACGDHLARVSFVWKEDGVEYARGHGPMDKPLILRNFHNRYFDNLTWNKLMLPDTDPEPKRSRWE